MAFDLIITKTEVLNSQTIADYYNRLKNLAISMFEWKGLPNKIPARFIENILFTYGRLAFVHDDEKSFMVARCVPAGKLNYYNIPVRFSLYGTDYNSSYDTDDMVLIRNNYNESPTEDMIRLFAQRLYETERTLDVNIKQQKTPMMIATTDKNRTTMQNVYRQYDGNIPFIWADPDIIGKNLQTLNTGAPFLADKLMRYKHEIWNECLSALGINNANTDKRERLITSEVDANDQLVDLSAEVMLLTRKEACQEINEKYGLNVSVDMRIKPETNEPEKGVVENGKIHD